MTDEAQWILLERFEAVAAAAAGNDAWAPRAIAGPAQETASAPEILEKTAKEIQGLQGASRQQIQAVTANTQALGAVQAAAKSSPGGGNPVANAFKATFTNALGMLPLVNGLLHLFGGGDEPPAPLVKYAGPPRMDFQAAKTPSGVMDLDYSQSGTPRAYTGRAAAAFPAAPIQINVQAMDSRSFLDHSVEIAEAVREAMLNLHAINDVVAEL